MFQLFKGAFWDFYFSIYPKPNWTMHGETEYNGLSFP